MKLKSKLNKLFINTVCEFPYQMYNHVDYFLKNASLVLWDWFCKY